MKVAFAGAFAIRLAERVRAHLAVPCDIVRVNDAGRPDDPGIAAWLADVDVLVTLAFTREMGAAAGRLKLVQVPGAGPTLPARQPFHQLPNVLMTPHVAGWTEGPLEARAKLIANNIHRVAMGEPPLSVIPPPL